MDIDDVRQRLGKPGYRRCLRCNGHSKVWVYDGSDPDEQTTEVPLGIVGGRTRTVRWSADLSRYFAVCYQCSLRISDSRKIREQR